MHEIFFMKIEDYSSSRCVSVEPTYSIAVELKLCVYVGKESGFSLRLGQQRTVFQISA
ncbi:hypothetical protein D3C86_1325570 [compost metagenome]